MGLVPIMPYVNVIYHNGRCEYILHPRFSPPSLPHPPVPPSSPPLFICIIQITVLFPDLRLAHPLSSTSVRTQLVGVIYRIIFFQKLRNENGGGRDAFLLYHNGNGNLPGMRHCQENVIIKVGVQSWFSRRLLSVSVRFAKLPFCHM